MMKVFIIGPDTEAANRYSINKAVKPLRSNELLYLYDNQVKSLNEAGFNDIDIVNRELSDKIVFALDQEEETVEQLFAFVRFDSILSISLLHLLTNCRDQSVVLTAARTSYLQFSEPVERSNHRLIASGRSIKTRIDIQDEFYGVAVLQRAAAIEFLAGIQSDASLTMSDVLHQICNNHVIEVVRWIGESPEFQKKTGGGSYAKSRMITRFRKEARGLGKRKLRDEIRFLKNLPEDLRSLYPQVHTSGEMNDVVYMEQEFLPYVTLREHLLAGNFSHSQAIERLVSVLSVVHKSCHLPYSRPAPSDYLEQYHFQRAWHRLRNTLERAPIFLPLLIARRLWINGEELYNVPDLLLQLEHAKDVTRLIRPDFVSPYAHGDLHFENIMIDPDSEAFRLVDPRGYDYCDIYYDLGKISHSTNGKYDFIHENRYSAMWDSKETEVKASLEITQSPSLKLYNDVDCSMREIYKQVTADPHAEKRALFAEVFHFCTMMPFHLVGDGKEKKAAAIYLVGVQLFNKLFRILGLSIRGPGRSIDPEFWGQREWRNVG